MLSHKTVRIMSHLVIKEYGVNLLNLKNETKTNIYIISLNLYLYLIFQIKCIIGYFFIM